MRSGFDLKKLINDLLALSSACLRFGKRLDMSSGKLDDIDLTVFCLSAGFMSQALQEAEDITMIEGEES